jgi:hypothetical protein
MDVKMDDKINAALEALFIDEDKYGQYVLGFRNSDGVLYRKINVDGLNAFVGANEGMPKHGFTNEVKDMSKTVQGCDAIFSYVGK